MKTNTYTTVDGASFTATSPADLMRQLRLDSWNPEDSEEAYRQATARAAESPFSASSESQPKSRKNGATTHADADSLVGFAAMGAADGMPTDV